MIAPICLFTYNRLFETKQTIEALQRNFLALESHLFIYSDGPRDIESKGKVNEVREYIKSISGFKSITIVTSVVNKGLSKSIIFGVTEVVNKYGKVIVLEDDLITSNNFLDFMNQALDFYNEKKEILSISGHSYSNCVEKDFPYDVTFGYRASSWGWATWGDRWNQVDWEVKQYSEFKRSSFRKLKFNRGGSDLTRMIRKQMNGEIDSWAIRFCFHQFLYDLKDVYPKVSKVENVGFNGNGENCDFKSFIDLIDNTEKRVFSFDSFVCVKKNINKKFIKNFGYKVRFNRYLKRLTRK